MNTVFWSEKTEARRQLGRPRRKWEDNIKWIFSRMRGYRINSFG